MILVLEDFEIYIYSMIIYRADLKDEHKLDMFNILSGSIEFYPGWNIQGVSPIKAPNLRQQISVVPAGASKPYITIEEIMAEMYVNRTVHKDLRNMVTFIRTNNTTKEER